MSSDKSSFETDKASFYAHKTTKDPKTKSYKPGQAYTRHSDQAYTRHSDQRFCNGYVVQNDEVSIGPVYKCPDDMISRPSTSKIKCTDITRCRDRECCVPRCMDTICDVTKPFAIANKPCADLQGDIVEVRRNCVPQKCCSSTPNHCSDYLKFNACPNNLVPSPSLDLFSGNETEYESLCCAKPANCETFLSRYECPLNMEDIDTPASQVCGLPSHAELSESILDTAQNITEMCTVELCCSPLPEPDLNAGWAAASAEEPDYHAEFVGHFLYNTSQLVMYNTTPGTTHLRRVEHCRVACAYKNPNGIESSSWDSFGRATGFVMVDDKQCVCQRVEEHAQLPIPPVNTKYFKTNQMDIVENLVRYEHNRFQTYTLAPVRTATYSFSNDYRGLNGKCENPLYLNGDTQEVPRLDVSDPLYNSDPKIECMNRCIDKHPTSRGFWTKIASPHSCACASDSCETVDHDSSYEPYEIIAVKHLPACPLFPETRNDVVGNPPKAIACLNCTDMGPETVCLEWAYLEPVSESSPFTNDKSWSCDNFTSCTKCTETECLEISCPNGRSNANRNVTDKCEEFCTDDDCLICDVHDPNKCIQKKCSVGEFAVNPNGIDGTHKCDTCPAGQYGPDGISCHFCQAGQYQKETGMSQCLACAAGKYASLKGMKTPCIDCPPMTTVSTTGNTQFEDCEFCSDGYHVVNSECVACEAGKYEVQGSCVVCPHGTRSEKGKSRGCVKCQGGSSVHKNECFACPRGRFRNTESICQACPNGWQQPFEGTTMCQKCPRGRFTFYEASATCFCLGHDDSCPSPIKLLPKEKIREKLEHMLHKNTDLIQPFLDMLGVKCIEDITESHGSCQACENRENSPFKCLSTESVRWTDLDNDNVPDYADVFPTDQTEHKDSDGDGMGDRADKLPFNRNETHDLDNDGIGDNSDPDRDNDGHVNIIDTFPNDPTEWTDLDGDGIGDNSDHDRDNDGYANVNDTFPNDPAEWSDLDQDGIGDNTDTDRDGDGFANNDENWPDDPTRSKDTDQDGVDDLYDAFPNDPKEWDDTDSDDIGNNADTDDDGDGVTDDQDLFPLDRTETVDNDGDGIGDNGDPDDDNDGHLDVNDDFPFDSWRHKDSDGDGVEDPRDAFPYDGNEWTDTDADGVGDNSDTYWNHPDRKSTVAAGRTPEIFVSDYADTQQAKSTLLKLVYEAVPYKTPDRKVLKSPLAGTFSRTQQGKFCRNFAGPEGQVLDVSVADALGYGNFHEGYQTGYNSNGNVRPYEGCDANLDTYRNALEKNFIPGDAENPTFKITINTVDITGSRANTEHVCDMSSDRRKYECALACRNFDEDTQGFILETSGRCRCPKASHFAAIQSLGLDHGTIRNRGTLCKEDASNNLHSDDYYCNSGSWYPYSGFSPPSILIYGCASNEVVYPNKETTICLATKETRIKECADYCRAHSQEIKGFLIEPHDGRCYCLWAEISAGIKSSSTYVSYDFIETGSPDELTYTQLAEQDPLHAYSKEYECMLRCQSYDPRFVHFMVKNSAASECVCATDECSDIGHHDDYNIYEVDSPYTVDETDKTCLTTKTLGGRLWSSDSLADPVLAQECANRCSIGENTPFFVLSANDDVCRCGVDCSSFVEHSNTNVYKLKDALDVYPLRKVDVVEFQSTYLGCRKYRENNTDQIALQTSVTADVSGVETCLNNCKSNGYDYAQISQTWGTNLVQSINPSMNYDYNEKGRAEKAKRVQEVQDGNYYKILEYAEYWGGDDTSRYYCADEQQNGDFVTTPINLTCGSSESDACWAQMKEKCAIACSLKNKGFPEWTSSGDAHSRDDATWSWYGNNKINGFGVSGHNGDYFGACKCYKGLSNSCSNKKEQSLTKAKRQGFYLYTNPSDHNQLCQCSSERPTITEDDSECSGRKATHYNLGSFTHSAVYEIPTQIDVDAISTKTCNERCQADAVYTFTGFIVDVEKRCSCTHTAFGGPAGTAVAFENYGYVATQTQNLSFTPQYMLPQVLDDYVYGEQDKKYNVTSTDKYWCNNADAVVVEPETDRSGDNASIVENCKRACTNTTSPITTGGKSWSNLGSSERIAGFYVHNGDGKPDAKGKCACLKSIPDCNTPTGEWDLHEFVGEECETITGPEINSAWNVFDGECASGNVTADVHFSDCEEQCYVNPNCTAFSYRYTAAKQCKVSGACNSRNTNSSEWKTYIKGETSNHRKSSSTTRREFKWIQASDDGHYCKGVTTDYSSYPFIMGQFKVFEGGDNNCVADDADCHVKRCGIQCYSGLYGPAGRHPTESQIISMGWPDGFGDVMKGFFVDRSTGECYCTTYSFNHCGEVLPGSGTAVTKISSAANYTHYDYQRECKEK
ncbi:thrombospondin type 3 repeat-containing protein [bacterium]|nr:thrombospondin type 3 repeat-containing protein [bacterium]